MHSTWSLGTWTGADQVERAVEIGDLLFVQNNQLKPTID